MSELPVSELPVSELPVSELPVSELPVSVVTGSSRGIGRAIAIGLAQSGLRVVVNYFSQSDAAKEVIAIIEKQGGEAIAVGADVGNDNDRKKLIEKTLDTFGRLDVLVNNAGITSQGRKDLLDADEQSWNRVFDTNLKGPFFLSQLAAHAMLKRQTSPDKTSAPPPETLGTIINITSVSAYAVSTNRADYCMAKSALQTMTQLFAVRLAECGIGVFEVCPGVIESDMTSPVKQKYDTLIEQGLWPIRRWGKPEDVAQAVSAIVSGSFPFSTGQRINVDGGFHIRTL